MIIDCISDLHGYYPQLKGGDLLIVAGDLIANDDFRSILEFKSWILDISKLYIKIIIIAGNHDNWIQERYLINGDQSSFNHSFICYLEDSGTEFQYLEDLPCNFCNTPRHRSPWIKCDHTIMCPPKQQRKLKIWGSPWTLRFPGMNPRCMAFTVNTEEELEEKWKLIPDDSDILVTHSPCHGILDWNTKGRLCGSISLREHVIKRIKPKLHVFGHLHEAYSMIDLTIAKHVNASHVNEFYEPVNKPIRIEL